MKFISKLILLVALFAVSFNASAQDDVAGFKQENGSTRVYAELKCVGTNFLGLNSNCNVIVDMGQPNQTISKVFYILDEKGKNAKFPSPIAALNYMGSLGWKFVQAYPISEPNGMKGNQMVYHWLLYKDINNDAEMMEGLTIKNVNDK